MVIMIGLLAWLALAWLVHGIKPDWDEPWLLRWCRTAADHPVRSALAIGLVAGALRFRSRGLSGVSDDRAL